MVADADRIPAIPRELHEREELLTQLASFERQARRGQAQLVFLHGEPGVGKTALVEAYAVRTAQGQGAGSVRIGRCEAAEPSQPFAPLVDIAGTFGGSLARAMHAEERANVIQSFLALVSRPSAPRAVVLEDLHWADAATLDLLRTVARRLRGARCLLIGTYRDEDVGAMHPLRVAIDDMPARAAVELEVPRLSPNAVRDMARGSGIDPEVLHRATAGNPFFVTEIIRNPGGTLPTSVRAAVLARVATLTRDARRALRAASVLGTSWERQLLIEVARCNDSVIGECLGRGLLEEDDRSRRQTFRHELIQESIAGTLRRAQRASLHRRAMAVLSAWPKSAAVEPARLARHAVGAGDGDAVLRLAPIAAGRASQLGAHREAAFHLAAALGVARSSDGGRRAELLEAHAAESRLADRVEDALRSQTAALAARRRSGDHRRTGAALVALSDLTWWAGRPKRARKLAEEAVALLRATRPHGVELAHAYAAIAQRHATAGDDDRRGLQAAGQAIRLAGQLGDERCVVHASISRGVIEVFRNPSVGLSLLEAAAERAAAASLHEEEARALINLVEAGRDQRRYATADRFRERALACVEAQHLDVLRSRLLSDLADLALARGRWTDAAELAAGLVADRSTTPIIRAKALVVLGHLRARRGDGDPWIYLDEALGLVGRDGEGQDLSPVRAARAEAAWLDGDVARAFQEALVAFAETVRFDRGWFLAEIAWWRRQATPAFQPPRGLPPPYALEFAGRHHAAAARWHAIGAPFHAARGLAGSADEGDLRDALDQFQALGAHRWADRVRDRLRRLGVGHVPRGPRRTTQQNPAGLTNRQLEVLELLRDGLTNVEIARRLVVSPKTVDHHVSAVLRKLQVRRRTAAARRADFMLGTGFER